MCFESVSTSKESMGLHGGSIPLSRVHCDPSNTHHKRLCTI